MATEVTLPALGESVTEGTVTQWLKSVGDTIEVDEPLLEISTDKVDTEIPSPVAGTILEIKAEEDDTVEVGAVLAIIGDEGESSSDSGAGDTNQDAPAADPEPQPEDPPSEAEEPATEPDEEAPAPEPEAKPASSGGTSGQAVTLPALGESVTEGTVTQWLKSVGDTVEVDEPLLEISTDKVDTEIPSPIAGTLLEIKVDEDETVEVGAELAIIGEEGAAPAESSEPEQPKAEEPEPEPEPEEPKQEEAPKEEPKAEEPQAEEPKVEVSASSDSGSSEGYVTPIVRKLAKQHGVDLATVTGSGVGGRIRKQDILDAAEKNKASEAPAEEKPAAAAPAPAETSPLRGRTDKLTRLRKTIANRMVESLQVAAQLTQVHEVDVTEVVRLRAQHKNAFLEREGVKLTYLPFFAKAAIEALKQYPQVNAALDLEGGTVTYPDGEHLSIAVDTERGLLAPTIKDAGDLNIAGLARKIADIADRTRNNKILPDELSGGTFSITNLGSNGALFDTPIINQPQVAILGVGSIVKRPVVITDANGSESIAIRSMAYLALTYDHRIIDGADAGRFLTAIKERLQAGAFEGELG
ncbi:2-oxoglutarate dehydrogenase, E2 component, dihydrolipoamide succinyltransferase [Aeromicrobium tamlense]|uniref:Dihydrolipoamide acetyltransferase component of pyruvate dehydrogenase complex n=1 Tax=Aeromicrobium tamlense TaxID=375541 RepID=A0A8I0FXV0_9ACTN|nr:2-oxoglutarate dehydrogenase, E2 component, dihydrolipoamide succinyltransferase [Aeromicrobium tamlense]MBD1271708.1 2-oxoglutarate dehydrogenase, E2 component, dihydrolipoamide succinyltransferase [Aeromicrobium tamlense]NYI37544.1 2-oxoglutarate dehydrogenase E2 component (dihydrolipoamide succinyltransferase) [Aeromicrobium tamlense]